MADSQMPRHQMFAGIGIALVASTLFEGWAPDGPWGSESFTRGTIGLLGAFMIYFAWFRHKFGFWGAIPILSLWENPESSIRIVASLGIALIFLARIVGEQSELFPAPFGLIIMLGGLLMIFTAVYAWLVFEGPLGDEEE
ncbi:MAG: hypothetical protein VYC11_01210 [Candidatus Thermoplasmatota archaeon]|jgi:hypothetical protein|nr:hypothetical protein [Euryarchaeota archaeon]MEC7704265.1 hypothetical protein [Candidatus Thermoplasmatota archaeon]MEC9089967.1 hypothetical protein [Candidatus Thermoplasmatota archaeon]MED5486192.1 hypothetical protein [Candidatus Thermoplasmatota archaeon]|tara:strand:- start:78 stop:497 length:420 start_codon:yes stop_codon:yes gene_type:complete